MRHIRSSLLTIISLAILAGCASPVVVRRNETGSNRNPPPPAVARPRPTLSMAAMPPAPPLVPKAIPVEPRTPMVLEDKLAILQKVVAQEDRLYRVAAPLLINNAELCPQHARNLLGFTAKNKYSYSEDFISVAQSGLGLQDRLRVMNVLPGSGAELAGIRQGDLLLVAGIEPLPQGKFAQQDAASLIASELQGRSQIHLTVSRDGERVSFDVPLTFACAMVVVLGNTDEIASYADGRRIMITRGMLDAVRSDDELAYVLAMEVANNIATSTPRSDVAAVIDRLRIVGAKSPADNLPPGDAHAAFAADETKDKLTLYLLARANFDVSRVPEFWRRLSAKDQGTGVDVSDSPSAGGRMTRIAEWIKTIEMKHGSGLPLVP